ncbi:MAG: acylphosphatase [Acidobacteria bacterium]|nr:acylphosphatase [Acidobacteriota bacterium]
MKAGARILIGGFVQGVGFRYFVYRHASRLGLVGFTRNLRGGEVEIELEGERTLIESLLKQARTGPIMARVDHLRIDWQDCQDRYTHFEIRH